jgi:hypothetical protein
VGEGEGTHRFRFDPPQAIQSGVSPVPRQPPHFRGIARLACMVLDRMGLVAASRTAAKWRVICAHCLRATTVLSAKTTASHPRQKGIFELDACPVPGSIGKNGET